MAAKLGVTATTLLVPANAAVATTPNLLTYTEFINTLANVSFPRVINMWTETRIDPTGTLLTGSPFQAHIVWTSGGGKGGDVWVTGAGGGLQLFLNCKSVRVDIANWEPTPRQVFCSIQDGEYGQSQELHYVNREQALGAGAFRDFGVVPYGREVTVASDVPAQRANILVQQLDAAGVVMAAFPATSLHIPCGAASRIRVRNNDPAALANYTVDYRLGYL